MVQEFEHQTALVTGASRGIGKAIAITLGKNGATVIGTATTKAGASAITDTLQGEGIRGQGHILDVADAQSVQTLAEFLKTEDINPAILVNNAGITRDNLFMRMKDDEWDDVINTNLNSIYRLCKICMRSMIKARYGRIINITSVVALTGNPGQANYAAAKAGILGFTRSLAREIGSRNITVNTVAPGFIATDMTADLPEAQQQQMLDQIALGRLGESDEIAAAVRFLASSAAAYITGETLNVNGGMYMS